MAELLYQIALDCTVVQNTVAELLCWLLAIYLVGPRQGSLNPVACNN